MRRIDLTAGMTARRGPVRTSLATTVFALSLASLLLACSASAAKPGADSPERLIVLGFDGMDYEITRRLLDEGRLPNMARVAR